MKSLVTYDSAYGNTALIAEAICTALSDYGNAVSKHVDEVTNYDIAEADLIVIGSPTQGGRPTGPTQQFIEALPVKMMRNKNIALFDTRFETHAQNIGMRLLMRTIGFAAAKMAKSVERKGLHVVSHPTGFIVNDTKGPLHDGEPERAAAWAADLVKRR